MRKLARATATAALTVAAVAIPLTGTAMASTATAAPAQAHRLLHKPALHNNGWCGDSRYNRHHRGHYWSRWDDNCGYRNDWRGYRNDWRGYRHVNYRTYDDYNDHRNCYRNY
ncbi:hypothetical protein ACFWN5_11635 [Streptomyces sp. NPDC058430]|uniref:hypothetical protein n=1 Tax=Streptomyces sp. NPDC058430 TaxID=3346495 RepID=UPI00364BAC0F